MRYLWLPYTMQKQTDFLFPKEKKRIKTIHGFSKIVEELYLLFIWKTEDATKTTNSPKCSAAVVQQFKTAVEADHVHLKLLIHQDKKLE